MQVFPTTARRVALALALAGALAAAGCGGDDHAGDGNRAAAEFNVNGVYKVTDSGLPDAKGQTYKLPAGTFFAMRDGKIARVTTYYNLTDWIAQVSG